MILMMERLDRLANEFKDTVHALKSGKGMARRISPVKRPRSARSPSVVSEPVGDDDMDRDSMASFGSRTPRKKLLAEWILVSTLMKTEHDKESAMEVFGEIAAEDLAISGPIDDERPKKSDLGGFKINRVSSVDLCAEKKTHSAHPSRLMLPQNYSGSPLTPAMTSSTWKLKPTALPMIRRLCPHTSDPSTS